MKTLNPLCALLLALLILAMPLGAMAQTKIAFVTSETTTGAITELALTGIEAADAICQRLAAAAGTANIPAAAVADGFKAWLSDGSTSPSVSFIQATVPYVLVDGSQIAPNWAGLIDGTLDTPLQLTELGAQATVNVYTSTSATGTPILPDHCSGWTSAPTVPPIETAVRGNSTSTDSLWTNVGLVNCAQANRLYCFQQGLLPVELQSFSID